jgi:pyruvate/2-oxoglutarate dehydrogenase complex dihydrolipoamide dehydrogenase (E3) component
MKLFNHIIVGTGQATGTLLARLIPTGESIAIIEGNKVGGTCVNYGCTPTKTMVASAKAIHQARRGNFYGFKAEPILDFNRVMERMNEVRSASSNGLTNWIETTKNVTLIKGMAAFTAEKIMKVNDEEIEGEKIYLNVGTRSIAPPIHGLGEVEWMDNSKLLELKKLPNHLLIIGGGYIGIEFSQIFRRFGSEVTIIQRNNQLMPFEDNDVAQSVKDVLESESIHVMLNANILSVRKDGEYYIEVETIGKKEVLKGTHLLIAAGRKANSDTLDLDKAGIRTYGKGFIEVDEHCQTNVEGVFAVGDVNGHGAFTHTAVNDGEIVLDFLFNGSRKLSQRILIYGLFTDPPLGRVGLTEKAALEKGLTIMKATMPMSRIGRAKEMGETKGFAKLIVDAETDLILGASIHGSGGDEIINMFAAIMHSRIQCKRYREVVLVHPTVSELMPYVLDGLKIVQ